jgi:hypothetical protein
MKAVWIASLVWMAGSAHAAPVTLTHQGRLLDAFGAPISGDVDLDVLLFDADTGGNVLHTGAFTDVPLQSGHYAVVLGATGTLASSVFEVNPQVWVEVRVGGTPIGGRQLIRHAPVAAAAAVASSVPTGAGAACGGGQGAGGLRYSGGALQVCDGSTWAAVASNPSHPSIDCYFAEGSSTNAQYIQLAGCSNAGFTLTDSNRRVVVPSDGVYHVDYFIHAPGAPCSMWAERRSDSRRVGQSWRSANPGAPQTGAGMIFMSANDSLSLYTSECTYAGSLARFAVYKVY